MTVELNPETERLVREEIDNGHFRSVDELIVEGPQTTQRPLKNLAQFLLESPFAGSALDLERATCETTRGERQ